ncbi:MAG: efflux RND transporter periplasmic adaptor subunit [Candidatus Obscuribacterales bacterium]|nr:efflux RND transporter periplasmic adaptor subunit [Candidatus Obscuribacterales bacterium]MCC7530013.1 efflux RND transporter periplasmic adaptor subunit [Candidatus Melainabacteria bacterium]
MTSQNFAAYLGLCLLMLPLAGCTSAPQSVTVPVTKVDISKVTTKPQAEKSEFIGTVRSRKSVTISPNVSGHIEDIRVSAGQLVHAGDVLMSIDSRMQSAATDAVKAAAESAQSDLATAKATLASLESTFKSKQANLQYTKTQCRRYQSLSDDGAVSDSELDSWKNNLASAQSDCDATIQQMEAQKMTIQKHERTHKQALANLQTQIEQLRYYHITAPFTGIVGDIPVKLGDHVTASTALTTVTENHPLEVYVSVPAEKATPLRLGTNVSLVGSDGTEYGASKVIFISPTVDPGSQTVLVKTLYPNTDDKLRADQTVKAQIVWNIKEGVSVPTRAVVQTAGKYYVFLARQHEKKLVAEQVEIAVNGIDDNAYQVKSGLKPSDRIVTSGIQRLANGAQIASKDDDSSEVVKTGHSWMGKANAAAAAN